MSVVGVEGETRQPPHQLGAAHQRHNQVGYKHVNLFPGVLIDQAQRLGAVGRLQHFVAILAQRPGDQRPNRGVVLGKQHRLVALQGAGRSIGPGGDLLQFKLAITRQIDPER